jgi:hypothetical protein
MDVRFDRKLQGLHDEAKAKGLWRGTAATRDREEYWVAGVEAYFDAAGAGPPPIDAERPIDSREALQVFDPGLYALVHETMAYRGRVDRRYKP